MLAALKALQKMRVAAAPAAPALIKKLVVSGEVGILSKDILVLIGAPAMPLLADGVKSSHSDTRYACAKTLAAMGRPALPVLIELLKGKKEQVYPVLYALASMGMSAQDAVPAVLDVLVGNAGHSQTQAAGALVSISNNPGADFLARVKSEPAPSCVVFDETLAVFGPGAVSLLPDLRAMLKDTDVGRRSIAVRWLKVLRYARPRQPET